MKRILWVGDAACTSGFAKATHNILDVVRQENEVTVLGINYLGDSNHGYPYDIYCARVGGDLIGINRITWMCQRVKPQVIVFQNDGWNLPLYVEKLREKLPNGEFRYPGFARIPLIAIVAVDGKNFRKHWLDGISYAIFWTDFALKEAREGGYEGPACVIPLGVDTDVYKPMDRKEARLIRGMPPGLDDMFVVGNVNRNQPRKRWDLTIRYFAQWVKDYNIKDAALYLHAAPTADMGVDVQQLVKYYGIGDVVIVVQPEPWDPLPELRMRHTYCCFDVQVTTTGGEGFGLTTFEGMACGIPQIVPQWSALGDLVDGAAAMVPCTSTALNPIIPALNVIHGVPDERMFIETLNNFYRFPQYREDFAKAGYEFVQDAKFQWPNVARRFSDAIAEALTSKPLEIEHAVQI